MWWELPADATKDDLRGAMQAIFDAYLPHKTVMAAVVEVASYDPSLRERFGNLVQGTIDGVAAHIARGQEHGFVDPDLDPKSTAAWLTWMAERGRYQIVAPAREDELDRLLGALTDITWNTLYVRAR